MKALYCSCLALLAALASGNALAHRGHDTLSVVRVDAKGAVLVTHHLTAHDIEPGVLRQIAPDAQPSLDDPHALDALTGYVGEHFLLAEGDQTVVLTLDKTMLAGDDIELRYRGQLKDHAAALQVRDALLADVFPEIDNQVNVHRDGITRTLRFTEAGWQPVPQGTDG